MYSKIKYGMVGGGEGAFIGDIHRIAARIDNRYELVAGALSADADKAARSAQAIGIDAQRSYASFVEMAAVEKERDDGIDVVVIVTPNHMHFPVAKAFLEQGIAVICDKPATLNLAQAHELAAIITRTGGFFRLTHNYTGYPLVRYARELVQEGKLGELRLVQVEYAQDWLSSKEEDTDNKQAKWRTDPSKSGAGGSLGDIGTHAFNLAQFMSDLTVSEVCADIDAFVEGRVLDDNAHVLLRFNKEVKGILWCSQVAPGNANALKIRIYGAKGGLEWSQEDPNELLFSPLGEPTQKMIRAGHGISDVANRVSRTPAGHPEGYLEGFANLYSDIADALILHNKGEPIPAELQLIPGIKEGVAGLQFVESVVESSKNNSQWVSLNA
ncbi:MAG: Gfo/Idh/MocA family oxidoreductase [Oceanospirillaceae bacterium]|nr:Gfo/Idh/MocA family oxidoreductase [Oceanospirillaceae bacterium]